MADLSRLDALLPQISGIDTKPGSAASSPEKGGSSFSDILKGAVDSVNNVQFEADQVRQKVQRGEIKDIDETMIALQKADVSLKVMLEVRNKILEAYQEVMRTQM
ncbi:MAG: flagellar hook-basal body complex protein FliE [Deferribacteraceae bacterium]|jgi:flagellar hook-basal body complex protein FliE|nr:flagellar hook-basal body complex protein FliE [Deferribacteraceae bacterium]